MKKFLAVTVAGLFATSCAQYIGMAPEPTAGTTKQEHPTATRALAQVVPPPLVVTEPTHVAVPNLLLTGPKIEALMRNFFRKSQISSVNVVSQTLQWVQTEFNYTSPTYTLNSQVWVVTLTGNMQWPFAITHSGTIATGSKAYVVLDSERGGLLYCNIRNQ